MAYIMGKIMRDWHTTLRRERLSSFAKRALGLLALAALGHGSGAADLSTLQALVQGQPTGTWIKVNQNTFAEVMTPPALIPMYNETSHNSPANILIAWSGFAWDTNRGNLVIFGGGHANYPGNEVYTWNGSSLLWERSALPSQIKLITTNGYEAVDGALNAPISAHTYDTTTFLPVADRLAVFGGASWNQGAGFITQLTDGSIRSTGPYLFDPAKADMNMVGGTSGSGVDVSTPGAQMWDDRDLPPRYSNYPGSFINATAGYTQINGKEVVYVEKNDLYRYTLNDLADASLDTWEVVGINWGGGYTQGGGAYDPVNNFYVRTLNATNPFEYWNLDTAGAGNRLVLVPRTSLILDDPSFQMNDFYGMDYDPVRQRFVMWDGISGVWSLTINRAANTWTVSRLPSLVNGSLPNPSLNGVIGKWKYAANLDAFVALFDNGDVYVYKLESLPDYTPPTVALVSPPSSATVGVSTTLTASAGDDVGVASVEFRVNGFLICSDNTAPYTCAWTPDAEGSATIEATALDAAGNSATASASVSVLPPPDTTPPTVQFVSPPATATVGVATTLTASASDTVGVTKVEFRVNGSLLCTATASPYTCAWTPAATGTASLEAKAYDAAGNSATASASVSVLPPPDTTPPTVQFVSPPATATVGVATTLTASASDTVGVTKVEFRVNGSLLCTATASPYTCAWTPAATGTASLEAKAYDAAGNSATATATVTVNAPADTTAPVFTAWTPQNSATVRRNTSLTLSATATDAGGIKSLVFSSGATVLCSFTSGTGSCAWTTPATTGKVTLVYTATDMAGNKATKQLKINVR